MTIASGARLTVVLSGSAFWIDVFRDVGHGATVVGALVDDRIAEDFSIAHPDARVFLGNDLKFGLFDRRHGAPTPTSIKKSASYLLRERQALYSMQRLESGGSVEFPVREHYLSAMTDYFWSFIEVKRPTHLLLSEAPHTPECLILSGLFESSGLPILQFEQCGILPRARVSFWPSYSDFELSSEKLNLLTQAESDSLRNVTKRFELSERTNVESERLREEGRYFGGFKGLVRRFFIPFSMRRDEQLQTEKFFAGGLRDAHPRTLHSLKPPIRTIRQIVLPSFGLVVRQWRQLRRIRLRSETSRLPSGPFATYFLHFEPERTSMPDGGVFADQLFAIRSIAASLGQRLPLVVVEHPSQAGLALRGFRSRREHFYDEIMAIPGVFLVSRDVEREQIFSSSKMIITLTGTVALEAVSRGVPVLCLGYPWYRGLEGVTLCDASEGLSEAIDTCLSGSSRASCDFERSLVKLLEARFLPLVLNPSNRHRFDEPEPAIGEVRRLIGEFLRVKVVGGA